jgi:hypothetical protein
MGKLKKMKKLAEQAHADVERAERAADRAEQAHRRAAALMGTEAAMPEAASASQSERGRFYTAPAGLGGAPTAAR